MSTLDQKRNQLNIAKNRLAAQGKARLLALGKYAFVAAQTALKSFISAQMGKVKDLIGLAIGKVNDLKALAMAQYQRATDMVNYLSSLPNTIRSTIKTAQDKFNTLFTELPYVEVDVDGLGDVDQSLPLMNQLDDLIKTETEKTIQIVKSSADPVNIVESMIQQQGLFDGMSGAEMLSYLRNQMAYITHPTIGDVLKSSFYCQPISETISLHMADHVYPDIHELDLDNWSKASPFRSSLLYELDKDKREQIIMAYANINNSSSKCVPNEWPLAKRDPTTGQINEVKRVISRTPTGPFVGLPYFNVIPNYIKASDYNFSGDAFWNLLLSEQTISQIVENTITSLVGDRIRMIKSLYAINSKVAIDDEKYDVKVEGDTIQIDKRGNKVVPLKNDSKYFMV